MFLFKENDIELITPFLQLPTVEDYPDYYESIEESIDMSMIKGKIDKGQVNLQKRLSFISMKIVDHFSINEN